MRVQKKRILVIYFDRYGGLKRRLEGYNIEADYVYVNHVDDYLHRIGHIPDVTIVSGSKRSIFDNQRYPAIDRIIESGHCVIGICYGFEYMAQISGGTLKHTSKNRKLVRKEMYEGQEYEFWYNHYDSVISLPLSWKVLKWSERPNHIDIAISGNQIGFQFHPEKRKATFQRFILPYLA